MNAKKSLIALSVFSILMGGLWDAAVAKKADKEEDSVHRWGRWAVLSPAAGQEETGGFTTIAASNDLGSCQSSENCPKIAGEPVEPPPPPPPPPPPEVKSPCEAGTPCGFARIDTPYTKGEAAPISSEVVPFELTLDEEGGTAKYAVDPKSPTAIVSDSMPAYISQNDVLAWGDNSVLTGKITRNELDPAVVIGAWENTSIGDGENTIFQGGEYVWGITATQAQMQNFIDGLGGDKIATYSGFNMGAINGNQGSVSMTVNFSDSSWSGQFNNNAFSVADGVVVDSGFVTTANSKFSNNIAKGEVYGVFVNAGNNAIGAYDVTDKGGIHSADVFKADLVKGSIPQ